MADGVDWDKRTIRFWATKAPGASRRRSPLCGLSAKISLRLAGRAVAQADDGRRGIARPLRSEVSKVGILVPGDVPGIPAPTRADGLAKCQKWLPAHLNSHLASGETEESSHLLGMARLHSFAVTGPSSFAGSRLLWCRTDCQPGCGKPRPPTS